MLGSCAAIACGDARAYARTVRTELGPRRGARSVAGQTAALVEVFDLFKAGGKPGETAFGSQRT